MVAYRIAEQFPGSFPQASRTRVQGHGDPATRSQEGGEIPGRVREYGSAGPR